MWTSSTYSIQSPTSLTKHYMVLLSLVTLTSRDSSLCSVSMVEWLTSPQVPGPNWAVWWRKGTLRSWACGLWPHWAKTWAKKRQDRLWIFDTFWHQTHWVSRCQPSQLMSCLHKFKTSMNESEFPRRLPRIWHADDANLSTQGTQDAGLEVGSCCFWGSWQWLQ